MDLEKIVKGYITNSIAQNIAKKFNIDVRTVQSLIDKAVPLLLGGMANNAAKDENQAAGLFKAITKDHDGSVFGNLETLLQDPKALKADKILQHVLGGKEEVAETALATEAGIKKEQSVDFMQVLAPMVMGALGKEQSEKNLEADHLAKMFAHEKTQVAAQKASNPLLSLIDQEGDGVTDDLLKMGMSFLNRKS